MRALRVTIAWVLGLLTAPAAIGILYLLRSFAALSVGPEVTGSLPLQQLAHGEAQPFLHVLVAWVPAGLVAGLLLRHLGRVRPAPGLAALAAVVFALLIVAGAGADAVAVSEHFGPHLGAQFHRTGTWVAVTCLLVGAGIAWWWPARPQGSPPLAPSAS
jgi:hypothetical protein